MVFLTGLTIPVTTLMGPQPERKHSQALRASSYKMHFEVSQIMAVYSEYR